MVTLPPDEMTQDFHKLYPNARYFGSEWVKDDNAAPQTKPCLYPEDPMFKTFFQTFSKSGSKNTARCTTLWPLPRAKAIFPPP